MGQTLTHGIYLPDEGERNCYDGLASNWSILDGAVGTVAEHTTALAGKAPAVHTHTKADITDLFNSANTWTENNTYSKAITVAKNSDTNFFLNTKHTAAELGSLPSSDQSITWAFKDKNDDNLCYARVYYETTGSNSLRIFVRNKYASGAPSTSGTVDYAYFGLKINADKSKEAIFKASLRPYDSTYNHHLGDSTYKWKTLNGINPGALSLPNVNAVAGSSNTQLQDISGDLVQDQYFNCYFTPRMDGWAYIALNCSSATIRSRFSSYTVSVKTARSFDNAIYTQSFTKNENVWTNLVILFPVTANKEITLEYTFTGFSVTKAYVIPAQGNV